MKNFLAECAKGLSSPLTTHVAAASAGAIAVAAAHYKVMRTGRVLDLGPQAFNDLVNGDTQAVRFTHDKHDHTFIVTLEQ